MDNQITEALAFVAKGDSSAIGKVRLGLDVEKERVRVRVGRSPQGRGSPCNAEQKDQANLHVEEI